LFATTAGGWSGLWSFVLNHDLIGTFIASLRTPRDPIFDLLAGPRRARAVVNDGMWVRIMDPRAALEARSYQSPFHGVIKIVDELGYASGTFELDLSPDGAEVVPSSKSPDIILMVADLGAIYMGRPALAGLARVGRVSGDIDMLKQADRAFNWYPQPWCPEVF
jgi:predicted acetyltransferase